MTPKFDSLASLLMEMPSGYTISPELTAEIKKYLVDNPRKSQEAIARHFGLATSTIGRIGGSSRGHGFGGVAHKYRETHPGRRLTDAQEKETLDYWLANHHETTGLELARWIYQKFGIEIDKHTLLIATLPRAAAKYGKTLPPSDSGKGMRLRRLRSQHRTEPGSGKLPTQGSQHFNPGTTINPPKPPE